jgi:hypothetical protein
MKQGSHPTADDFAQPEANLSQISTMVQDSRGRVPALLEFKARTLLSETLTDGGKKEAHCSGRCGICRLPTISPGRCGRLSRQPDMQGQDPTFVTTLVRARWLSRGRGQTRQARWV